MHSLREENGTGGSPGMRVSGCTNRLHESVAAVHQFGMPEH